MFKQKHCFLNGLLLKYWVVETQLISALAQACLSSFTLHKMCRLGVHRSYPQTRASSLQRRMEQACLKAESELGSGIITAALSPFVPARLWATCGCASTWRSHVRKAEVVVLTRCGGDPRQSVGSVKDLWTHPVWLCLHRGARLRGEIPLLLICCLIYPWWRFLGGHWAAFLALFCNCLKQHSNMFILVCVLHIKTQTRSACQKTSLSFPCSVGGLGSWDFCATRAVCVLSGSCHLQHGWMFTVMPCFGGTMTKETAEPWTDCRDMSWESRPESSAHTLWCWLTVPKQSCRQRRSWALQRT